jgi:hypothetical protein
VRRFLNIYLGGDGRIAIAAAAPGTSLEDLRELQRRMLASGVRSWIMFDDAAIDHEQNVVRHQEVAAAEASQAPCLAVLNRALDHVILMRGPAPEPPQRSTGVINDMFGVLVSRHLRAWRD